MTSNSGVYSCHSDNIFIKDRGCRFKIYSFGECLKFISIWLNTWKKKFCL
jgi:hypothetical protein